MGCSIIIPAYNEEETIRSVLRALVNVLTDFGQTYEIIVVNDGSTDRTRDEVLATGLSVILVDHLVNKGYGAALKSGINKARYETVVITDSDGTYPIERIPELVSMADDKDWDMIVGARIGDNVNIQWIRRPAKWAITKLANYLSGKKFLTSIQGSG